MIALSKVIFESSDLTNTEEEREQGREEEAAKEEISWAILKIV